MPSLQRLSLIESLGVTVVCCTPSYALHLAEVALSVDGGYHAGRRLTDPPGA